MSRLTKNDQEIIRNGVFDFQRMICQWNEDYTCAILKMIAWVASNAGGAIWALNYLVPPYVKAVAQALQVNIIAAVAGGLASVQFNLMAVIRLVVFQIQQCFAALEIQCPVEILDPPPPVIGVPGLEVPELTVTGFGPCQDFDDPCCILASFASWQAENGEKLELSIVNPCVGTTDYSGSCFDFGVPGAGPGVSLEPGESFGGTDADGDVNIGGSSFGDPSAEDGDPEGKTAPGSDD
jgi:hypothetical protein